MNVKNYRKVHWEPWTLTKCKDRELVLCACVCVVLKREVQMKGKGRSKRKFEEMCFTEPREQRVSVKQWGMAILKLHSLKNYSEEGNRVHSVSMGAWERKENHPERQTWEQSRTVGNMLGVN